jgi:hypothetical protein
MALGSTQHLTEMSTRNIPGGEGRPAPKADITAICEPIVYKMWEPQHLTALWVSTAPGNHWIGGWMGSRTGLNAVA